MLSELDETIRQLLIKEGRLLLIGKTGRTGRPVKSLPKPATQGAEGPR